MTIYTITQKEINLISYALTLASYFVHDNEPSEQNDSDRETVNEAFKIITQLQETTI